MKEQFVTYEIALKLKELGFDEECFGLYKNKILFRYYETFTWNDFSNSIKAPLWQQVIDWLREEHGIHIIINKTYGYVLLLNKRNPIGKNNIGNYYQAREQAILKALELIEQNNEKNN